MNWRILVLLSVLGVFAAGIARADDAEPKKEEKKKDEKTEEVVDKTFVTQHTATIGDKEIKYTATAGTLVMKDDEDKPKAKIFFIAYTKDGVEDAGKRPITFAFNGGPGSSSVWLHLGMLGPKRVKVPDDASASPPPYELVNNPYSLLDITDLVFIDPVSTGFSRPAKGENDDQFHGYEEDIHSVAQFIHNYVTKFGRWRSPKFVIGESYGGLRAAGLAGYLRDRYNMPVNGIIMVSPALNYLTIAFSPGNDLPFVLFTPSYATTAWYHKALPADLQALPVDQVYKQAEEFAMKEYAPALMKGQTLSAEERAAVAEKLARYTGLSKDYVESANLRVDMQRFAKELLRKRGKTVGRYDSRYTGIDADNAGENPEYDPSAESVFGAFTANINDYLRNDLKVEDDRVYEIISSKVQPWKYSKFGGRYPDASETLRQTMSADPFVKLFVASGFYDLATPADTVAYSVEHMRLPAEQQKNIKYGHYEGGHMMYIYEPSMKRLREDLEKFYAGALEHAEPKKPGS